MYHLKITSLPPIIMKAIAGSCNHSSSDHFTFQLKCIYVDFHLFTFTPSVWGQFSCPLFSAYLKMVFLSPWAVLHGGQHIRHMGTYPCQQGGLSPLSPEWSRLQIPSLFVPVGLCQGNAKAELLSFDEEFISTVLIQSVMDSGKVRG